MQLISIEASIWLWAIATIIGWTWVYLAYKAGVRW